MVFGLSLPIVAVPRGGTRLESRPEGPIRGDMRLVLPLFALLASAAPASADPGRGVCMTEPARVMAFDRARVKQALEASLSAEERARRDVTFQWIPEAQADARRADCHVIVRVAVRGLRSRARFDFVATLKGAVGFAIVEEVGPVDLARIDPRSFGKVWNRVFARLDPGALTRAGD